MRTLLFPCPDRVCGEKHALVYLVSVGGKRLGVNCSFNCKLGHTRFLAIPQAVIDVSDMDEKALEGIPIHYTGPAALKSSHEQNLGMALMWTQPGQEVERNVDLPRANAVADQILDDDIKAKLILAEIEQVKQARAEVQTQLNSGMATMARLDNQERDLRKELRKFWTQPLDFSDKPDVGS